MPFTTLSSVVQAHPSAIDSTLEKLSCSACGIDDIDIYPAALSALTAKGAPRSVADEVRAVVSVARQTRPRAARGDAAPPRSLNAHNFLASSSSATARCGAGDKEDASYLDNFNVGIAMSLHTVLLSRNRIASLLGIVQFRHCVRLSLLSNRIRTIEDCEPLALLPDLQYLSLEFNPVAQLPHYRAHLLRICAWPHELSVRTCRLRKLDSLTVNSAEVKRAVVCLRRELTLMPELLSRMQFLAFLGDVEKKHAVHRELRQRGVLLQQTTEKVTLQSTLERGAAYALDRVPVSGAAHLVRLLVRDRHRLAASAQSTVNATTLSSCPSQAPQPGADASATTVTFFGSDDLDTSKITSVSDIASCSLLSDEDVAAAEDARVLKSLSTLLGSKELSRSHPALLRRADAVDARETCKQWSHDAFRQTLSLLDVRVCAALLRLSRILGTTLDAQEVDRLCQVWLHAVTHCTPASGSGGRSQYNATGPRRIVTTAAVVGKAAAVPMAQTQGISSPAQRLPVEAIAPVHQNVWEIGDADGCLSPTSASSVCSIPAAVPAVSSDVTNACADISMTSLSSDSLLVPRETVPLPTAAASRPTTKGATPAIVSIAPADPEAQQHVPLPSTKINELPLKQREQGALSLQLSMAGTAYRQRSRQHIFQQWCTSLRHRWQTRIAAAYVRDKIDEATQHRCRPALRSPSWSGLITHVTYLERKRGFFNCWRGRTEERRAGRAVACGAGAASEASSSPCVLGGAPPLGVQPPLQQRPLIAEERGSFGTHHSTKRAVFDAWKAKAEAQALSRCTVARVRVRAESPQTPETFLTLHTRSLVARRGQSAISALPSPDAARQLLADLLSTGEKRTAVATSPPSLGFRRCMLAEDSPIKVTTWQSSAQTHAVSVKSASSLANKEGLSPVAPSSSDGISMNSITTPFLPGAPPTPSPPRVASPTAQESRSSSPVARCVATGGQPRHEPSPPPAIRILFPVKDGAPTNPTPHVVSPPHVPAVTAAVAVAASCGRSAARLYGGTQPSRLPSTTAARRAIRTSQSSPTQTAADSAAAPPASVLPEQMQRSSPSAASPYPVEDVEALVARSRQLEADRIFLLSEVRKLSTERGRQPAANLHGGLHPTFDVSSHDGAEERCVVQEREIKRLEAIVAALRDERRGLLSAVSPDIFRY